MDLKSVVEKYPESLNSAEKLRAYLTDLYPNEKAKVGIVVSIFSCGIAEEIERSKKIDDVTIERFCTRLENDYGYSMKLTRECIDLWLRVYGKTFTKPETIVTKNITPIKAVPPAPKTVNTSNYNTITNTVSKTSVNTNTNNILSSSKNHTPSSQPTTPLVSLLELFVSLIGITLIYIIFMYIFNSKFTYESYSYDTNIVVRFWFYVLIPPAINLILSILFKKHNISEYVLIGSVLALVTGFALVIAVVILVPDLLDVNEVTFNGYYMGLLTALIIEWVVSIVALTFKEKVKEKFAILIVIIVAIIVLAPISLLIKVFSE